MVGALFIIETSHFDTYPRSTSQAACCDGDNFSMSFNFLSWACPLIIDSVQQAVPLSLVAPQSTSALEWLKKEEDFIFFSSIFIAYRTRTEPWF